jgi:hypothetical protein
MIIPACGLLVVGCAVFFVLDRLRNHGVFVYIIDDPYIHLAMAKNLLAHGVWGVTPYEFSSASSSPLWVLVMTLGLLAARSSMFAVVWPLIVNLGCALGVIVVADRWLESEGASRRARWLLSIVLVIFTPIITLVFIGMEHTLHLLVWMAFLRTSAQLLDPEDNLPVKRRLAQVLLLASAMVMVRIEGVFAVAALATLLLIRARYREMFALGLSLLPLAGFSLWSIAHGGSVLPNSVLMKGKVPPIQPGAMFTFLTSSIYYEFVTAIDLMAVLLVVAIGTMMAKPGARESRTKIAAQLWIVTCVLHLQFAHTGWYFRYEAYLIATGFVLSLLLWERTVGAALGAWKAKLGTRSERRDRALVAALAIFAVGQPFLRKGFTISHKIGPLSSDVFRGNWQVGRFLRSNYTGRRVALNDIGATTYQADFHLVDLWGLGTLDVTRAARSGAFDATWAEKYCRRKDVEIGIFTRSFLDRSMGQAPASWKLVRRWLISGTDGPIELQFFAFSEAHARELDEKLSSFEVGLPGDVRPVKMIADRG